MYFDRRLWGLMAGLHGRVFGAAALGLVAMVFGILRFVFLARVLALSLRGAPVGQIAVAALATAACMLVRAWLDHHRVVVAQATAGAVQSALRARLFDRIAELGPAWFGAERTGGVMLAVIDGVEQLQTFFGAYLPQLIIAACAPVAIFVVLAWWDVPTAAVLLVAALVTLILPMLVHNADKRAARARSAAFKAFGEEFLDALQGLPTLKAFGQSAAFAERLADRARSLSGSTFWVLALGLLTRFFTDLGTALGAAAAIALGAWRVRHGEMTIEALLIILMAGTEIFRPLRDLRGVLHQGMTGQSAADRINTLLDARSDAPAGGQAMIADLGTDITFEDVGFAYPGRRGEAHAGLSFTVAAGETVGVVGPSGAGKSTILRLLLRQHDVTAGTVRIGGHDIRTLDPAQVRGLIAIVAQDTTLFDGTIADNLRLGRPEASAAEMEAAARAANAHGFITALPGGYASRIGERGATLSGGQRQRIAIARALLRDAPILVLDEALSAVDAENEAVIQQALDRLMVGRTTLILAHRLSSVIGADRILVLDGGRVVESGRHAELIARPGAYRRLMGPQLGQGGERPAITAAVEAVVTIEDLAKRSLNEDAAQIGWAETLRSLLGVIRPWRGKLALTVLCGVGRVAGFIGVSVLGALAVAAVAAGRPTFWLLVALVLAAPVAATLHWLESWLAHDMAYRLLAEMRIALFAKLDRLAPAYLLRRRSGDLVALATQDVETVEYFYAHTVAPSVVALVIPASVLALLAAVAWPLALVLLPFLAWAGLAPVFARGKIDRLAGRARGTLGLLGAHLTETIQGLAELIAFGAVGRRRDVFLADTAAYQRDRSALLDDLSRQTALFEVATGLGGLAVALTGAVLARHGWFAPQWLPLTVLVSVAGFMPVAEIGQAGRQLADTIASTRRLHVVECEPEPITDGDQSAARRPAGAVRRRALRLSRPQQGSAGWRELHGPARQHRRRGRVVRGGQVHRRQPAAAVLGPRQRRRHPRRGGPAPAAAGRPAPPHRPGGAGHLPVQRHAGGKHPPGRPRRDAGGRAACGGPGGAGPVRGRVAGRAGNPGRRARRAALGRAAATRRHRAGVPEGRTDPDPGRGDIAPGHRQRAADPHRARHADGGPDVHHHRAPAIHHPKRGYHTGHGGRACRGSRSPCRTRCPPRRLCTVRRPSGRRHRSVTSFGQIGEQLLTTGHAAHSGKMVC